jgi:hypothetical protein
LGFGCCGFKLLPPDHQLVTQHMQVSNLDCHGGKLLPVTDHLASTGIQIFQPYPPAVSFLGSIIWPTDAEIYPALALKSLFLKICPEKYLLQMCLALVRANHIGYSAK